MAHTPKKAARESLQSKRFKLIVVRAFLANTASLHKRHAKLLFGSIFGGILLASMWFGWELSNMQQLQAKRHVAASAYKDIKIESQSYNSSHFRGFITYVMTENKNIDSLIAEVAEGFFRPCKGQAELGVGSDIRECNATFTIDFASPSYMQITYTFQKNFAPVKTYSETVLIERSTGRRLTLDDIFAPHSNYRKVLANKVHSQLSVQFGKQYKNNPELKQIIQELNLAKPEHLRNFGIAKNENLHIFYGQVSNAIPTGTKVEVPAKDVYALLSKRALTAFFPKLNAQKTAQQKAAAKAEAVRRKVRDMVNADRSNIDCATMKCLALTFDDGPSMYTQQIAEILKSKDAVATFFVLGSQVATHAGALRYAADNKNEIASHGWSHADLTLLGDAAIISELTMTHRAIIDATNTAPTVLRPPYGSVDARVVNIASMPIVLWSVDTLDWKYRNPTAVYQSVISSASPGANILLHEIRGTTVQAVPQIIDELQRQGYVLVTTSELFGIKKSNAAHFNGKVLRHR